MTSNVVNSYDRNIKVAMVSYIYHQPEAATSFFISEIILRVMLQDYREEQFLSQKKDVGMGLVV